MAVRPSAKLPLIIQGGMGVAVSGWRLAKAVSSLGQLGLVSGTALDQVMVRRLQGGDAGGHIRRALDRFPFRDMAERAWSKYYIGGGLPDGATYLNPGKHDKDMPRELAETC